MSEEKKNLELSDDDLDAVNGGVFTGPGPSGPLVGIGGPGSVIKETESIGKINQVTSKTNRMPGTYTTSQQQQTDPCTAVPSNNLVSGGNYMV